MSEAAKVRLVRCPKCENLLPEVTDFAVYQCGGCGAVLEATNKGVDLDTFSEKSEGERSEYNMEKLINVSEKRVTDTSDNSENDTRSSISSSSRPSMNNTSISDYEADATPGKSSDGLQKSNIARDFEDLSIYDEKNNGLVRSGCLVNRRNAEKKSEMDDPSNLPSRHHDYAYENRIRNMNNRDVNMGGFSNNFEYLEDERAEALRKLDELKEQLSHSGNLIDKGKEKVPLDPRMMYQDYYHARENYHPDPNFRRPSYQNHYAESFPRTNMHEMGVNNGFYPPRYDYDPSNVQGYVDPLRSNMVRRRAHQDYAPSSQAYMPGVPYVDDGVTYIDKMKRYPSNFSHHLPLCSCYQCLEIRHLPPTAYRDRYANIPSDKMFNYHGNLGFSFGSRDYDHRLVSDPPHSRSSNGMLHTRWPSEANSEVDGVVNRRTQRVHLASSKMHIQHHRPVGGGAPFLTCYNCFELLLLPKRVVAKSNNKIRCGACSTVISFVFSKENNSIQVLKENKSISSGYVEVKENRNMVSSSRAVEDLDQERTLSSSDDYDNSNYGFPFNGREVGEISRGQGRANKFNETKNRNSTSTRTYEVEEDNPKNSTASKKESKLAEDSRPPAGSPLLEHFEFSNKYHRVHRGGEGNRSGRSEHDKVVLLPNNKPTIRRKHDSSATEIDLSSNEYPNNTGSTFDSGGTSGEGYKLKHGKSAESFLAEILKRSVKDPNRMSESPKPEKANVTVNGHLIPDRLVEKAEKLAGPIQPGNYWYDFRAGFWGVMGGPCLGIIPPFIEGFNYPMPEHCAGGDTQVFVNGRELNHKDLNLLASRGLPTENHRSYIVEISGRVLDEDTGEELESLGKLAPTVERAKHGFGMKPPKAAS